MSIDFNECEELQAQWAEAAKGARTMSSAHQQAEAPKLRAGQYVCFALKCEQQASANSAVI